MLLVRRNICFLNRSSNVKIAQKLKKRISKTTEIPESGWLKVKASEFCKGQTEFRSYAIEMIVKIS